MVGFGLVSSYQFVQDSLAVCGVRSPKVPWTGEAGKSVEARYWLATRTCACQRCFGVLGRDNGELVLIAALMFTETTIAKLAAHGITPEEVRQVNDFDRIVIRNPRPRVPVSVLERLAVAGALVIRDSTIAR
jgi:hypothetical protein